jgi:hypothetical protein
MMANGGLTVFLICGDVLSGVKLLKKLADEHPEHHNAARNTRFGELIHAVCAC